MNYNKFYTPIEVANLLLGQLKIKYPKSVVDICCGSHNLLNSAKQLWPNAKYVGVDVVEHLADDVECVKSDGRKFSLVHSNKFSLVLANPPFAYVKERREYPEILNVLPFKYNASRLENEMLLANLRLLDTGGTLMIIMPSTFINSKTNSKLREYISTTYHVKRIIRLPDEVFGSSKISSCALIINNTKGNCSHTDILDVTSCEKKYTISKSSIVQKKQMQTGYWDANYQTSASNRIFEYRRGTICSSSFILSGIPILHTAKLQPMWRPSVRYVNEHTTSTVYAEDGDIIVNRIGKAAGYWHIYSGDSILISDCLYRIKDPNRDIARKLKGYDYSFPLRGVAARYIIMEDFEAWYKSIEA